jgi:hypothetical protein
VVGSTRGEECGKKTVRSILVVGGIKSKSLKSGPICYCLPLNDAVPSIEGQKEELAMRQCVVLLCLVWK